MGTLTVTLFYYLLNTNSLPLYSSFYWFRRFIEKMVGCNIQEKGELSLWKKNISLDKLQNIQCQCHKRSVFHAFTCDTCRCVYQTHVRFFLLPSWKYWKHVVEDPQCFPCTNKIGVRFSLLSVNMVIGHTIPL